MWKDLDSITDFFDEPLNVLNLRNCVVQKELCVSVDPFIHGVLEFLDKWSGVDSQPSNIYGLLQLVNVISGSVQGSDSLVENFKGWFLGLDSTKNLVSHPFESLIDLFFSIIADFDLSLLSWVITSHQEGLEALSKSLFPEELFVLVLVNEFCGSKLNLVEVVGEGLSSSINNEVILNLYKVISETSVKSWNLNGE